MIAARISRATKPFAVGALLVGVALAAAGCTGSPHPGATSRSSQANAHPSQPTPITNQKQVPGAGVKVPTKIDNVVADRKNVTLTSCTSTQGGWVASGVAVNHGGSETSYKVTVYFTDQEATVIGTGMTTVGVAPGHVTRWRVATHLAAQPGGTRCVLVGVAK